MIGLNHSHPPLWSLSSRVEDLAAREVLEWRVKSLTSQVIHDLRDLRTLCCRKHPPRPIPAPTAGNLGTRPERPPPRPLAGDRFLPPPGLPPFSSCLPFKVQGDPASRRGRLLEAPVFIQPRAARGSSRSQRSSSLSRLLLLRWPRSPSWAREVHLKEGAGHQRLCTLGHLF